MTEELINKCNIRKFTTSWLTTRLREGGTLEGSKASAQDAGLHSASFNALYGEAELFLWEKTPKNSLNKSWGHGKREHKLLDKIKQQENLTVLRD